MNPVIPKEKQNPCRIYKPDIPCKNYVLKTSRTKYCNYHEKKRRLEHAKYHLINDSALSYENKPLVALVEDNQRENYEVNFKMECDEGHNEWHKFLKRLFTGYYKINYEYVTNWGYITDLREEPNEYEQELYRPWYYN